jgi:hypothetical protein
MQSKTYLVLAQYRKSSAYRDQIGRQYHFPKKYFNFLTLPNIQFVYYEPKKSGEGKYFGYGEVGAVTSDHTTQIIFLLRSLIIVHFRTSSPVTTIKATLVSRRRSTMRRMPSAESMLMSSYKSVPMAASS